MSEIWDDEAKKNFYKKKITPDFNNPKTANSSNMVGSNS